SGNGAGPTLHEATRAQTCRRRNAGWPPPLAQTPQIQGRQRQKARAERRLSAEESDGVRGETARAAPAGRSLGWRRGSLNRGLDRVERLHPCRYRFSAKGATIFQPGAPPQESVLSTM